MRRRTVARKPRTRYTQSQGHTIAYQVVGQGSIDLVFVPGFVSHIEMMWGDPAYARFMTRLSTFARLILFDRRGIGASQRVELVPTPEEESHDIAAVMDAAESRSAVVLGFSNGGPMAMHFAATQPQRLRGLVLVCTAAVTLPDDDQPGFIKPEYLPRFSEVVERWGEGTSMSIFAPSIAGGQFHRRLVGIFERAATTKAWLSAAVKAGGYVDVRSLLEHITVPTLVLQRTEDFVPMESGRYLADHIPEAKMVVVDGPDHLPFAGNANFIVGEIEQFLAESLAVEVPTSGALQSVVVTTEPDNPALGSLARRHGGERVGTLSVFDGPEAAMNFASEAMGAGAITRAALDSGSITVEAGEASGLCIHRATRLLELAAEGDMLISDITRQLAGKRLWSYSDRGSHELRGLPGKVAVFAAKRSIEQPLPEVSPRLGLIDRLAINSSIRIPIQSRLLARLVAPSPRG